MDGQGESPRARSGADGNTEEVHHTTGADTETEELHKRVQRLESLVERQQETIERHESTIVSQQETIADLRSPAESTTRRRALQAGGVLGLLGLGASRVGAAPTGQIGTDSRPLDTLYTAAMDGPIVADSSPVTSFSSSADADSVPVRDGTGELAVADASSDAHAVNRGQDVTWSGQHDFQQFPAVSGTQIVESGSNSNGNWIRWADGTQLCWTTSVDAPDVTGGAENVQWDLPASFASNEYFTNVLLNWDTMSRHDLRSHVTSRKSVRNSGRAACTVLHSDSDQFNDAEWLNLSMWAVGKWR